MPVTNKWERWVITMLAQKQSTTGQSVVITPEELCRTGFSERQAMQTLKRLIDGGHIWQTAADRYWVKRPRKTNRWLWETRQHRQ
jgi:hypothetical protein